MHQHSTRSVDADDLYTPFTSMTRSRNCSHYWGIILYNLIPKDARQLNSKKLQRDLKKRLTDKAYYSLEETIGDVLGFRA